MTIDSIPHGFKRCSLHDCQNPNAINGLLPISEFHKHKARKDGLCDVCKHCKARYHKKDSYKAKKREYNKSPKNKAYMAEYRQTETNKQIQRRYNESEAGKRSIIERQKRSKERHPLHDLARKAVYNAVKSGKLLPAKQMKCSHNGKNCRGQAAHWHHYLGYEQEHWLDVIPVCTKCHKEIHDSEK